MSAIAALVLLLVALVPASTKAAARMVQSLGRRLDSLSGVPLLPESLVFTVVLALAAIPTLLDAGALPNTPDEFSYLLAADTFAHGRLTNLRHPMWEHLETLHVLVTPTYASKYPPGQGLALALGQVIWKPIVGAWLACALAAAATCWMLRAVCPTRWAIAGGLLAGLHPQVFWWSQIYWGGCVAMLGGAILCGAAIRALKDPRPVHGAIAAIGMAILAGSRAYEGLILTILVAIVGVVCAIRSRTLGMLLRKAAPAASAVLIAAGAWLMYYNWRVTGDTLQMPYTLYAKQYQVAPLFYWQAPRAIPQYRHARIANYWTGYDLDEWKKQSTLPLFLRGAGIQLREIARSFFAPITILLALIGSVFALRHHAATRVAAGILIAFVVIHIATTPWMRMQYLGPVVPLFVMLIVSGLMTLNDFRFGAPVARAIIFVQLAAAPVLIYQMARNEHPQGAARANLVANLEAQPGLHLVLVEYSPAMQRLFEWVYNLADIDGARIVFAHAMGDRDAELLAYFANRRVWKLQVDWDRYELNEVIGNNGLRKLPPFATTQEQAP